jgi:ABC-type uncharacterized transport system substrate-binding protein
MRCCAAVACSKRPKRPDVRGGLNPVIRLLRGLLLLTGMLALGTGTAQAHPHVWITATSELIYAPDGSITGVRHAWTFDDMFSTYALQGMETNVESLKEFGFFTFAKADGRKQKFEEPVDYFLEYKDTRLTLHFTLPLKAPVKARTLALEVFDPEFFIDFTFADKDPVRLVGAPGACQMKFQRPNDGSANAKMLGEQNFTSGENANYGAMFANKITVDCP